MGIFLSLRRRVCTNANSDMQHKFYQTVDDVQHKFNIQYIQLSRLDFIPFILMHSQTSQFHIQVKINSQDYSNPIPSNFEPMITH